MKEIIKIDYKEWQEIIQDYEYQTNQASEYLLETQKYARELSKYKRLYENEKDHTDTLKRIIKKIEENLQELYIANDDKSYDLYKNILDLLKEIK